MRIGVSIGIGTASADGPHEPAELLAATDAALYRVKKRSKNNFAFAAPIDAAHGHARSGSPAMPRAA